ncbi:hypothetical protein [Spirochaeta dissipatitropha]
MNSHEPFLSQGISDAHESLPLEFEKLRFEMLLRYSRNNCLQRASIYTDPDIDSLVSYEHWHKRTF